MKITERYMLSNLFSALSKSKDFTIKNIMEYVDGDMADIDTVDNMYKDYDDLKKDLLGVLPQGTDASIKTCTFGNGNSTFIVVLFLNKGEETCSHYTVPVKTGKDMWFLGQKGLNSDEGEIIRGKQLPNYVQNLVNSEEFSDVVSTQQTLNKLPDDTGIHYTGMDSYNRVLSNFLRNTQMTNQDNKGIASIFAADEESGEVKALFRDRITKDVSLDPIDSVDSMDLVCCKNDDIREFYVYQATGIEVLESYGYVGNKTSLIRNMPQLLAEASIAREAKKAVLSDTNKLPGRTNVRNVSRQGKKAVDLDVAGRGAVALPRETIKKISETDTRLRSLIANWRRAHDDKLKDRLYNDEFIPLYDDIFSVVLGAAVGYGAVAFSLTNPILATAIGFLVFILANKWGEMNRKRVLELLESKIEIVKEEIEDAKSENDLTTKRNLMQILQQLERKRDKIRAGKTMGAR